MRSRIIQSIILAIMLALAQPVAAVESDDKAAFKAAYKAYQAAVEAGDLEATATAAEEALNFGKLVFPGDSPSLAALYVNYGVASVEAGSSSLRTDNAQIERAIAPLRQGIKRFEELYGKKNERLIEPLWSLADAYSKTSHPRRALPIMGRVLRLVRKINGEDSFAFAEANFAMGEKKYSVRDWGAMHYFQTAYDTYQQFYQVPAFKTGMAAFWLGRAAQFQEKYSRAEQHYLDAIDIFENSTSPGHVLQVAAHTYLIKLYEDRGKSDEATLHCQAISQLRPLVGVDGYKPLYKKAPSYPRSAQRAGRGGYVVVEFSVTTLGTVANATVVESEGGKDFERAALNAVSTFRYAPAVEGGKLIETTGVRNLLTFKIAN